MIEHVVLVCGSRTWDSIDTVWEVLDKIHESHPSMIIVSGGATGADSHAILWARDNHVAFQTFYPRWSEFGRGAGPKRNQEMLSTGPDEVHAFAYKLAKSRGTYDMVKRAHAAGIPCYIHPNGERYAPRG